MKALVFGEILWDIIEGTPHLGGAPLNFAAHVRQCGYPSAIVSCVGVDALGDQAVARIQSLDVETRFIQRSAHPTGTVPVTIVGGQPHYEITTGVAFDNIAAGALDHTAFAEYELFYFGSLIQRHTVSAAALSEILARHTFKEIFYDVNLRKDCYTPEILRFSLDYCTLLKVNDEEVEVLGPMLFGSPLSRPEFCQRIIRTYPQVRLIVVTAGSKGCFVHSSDQDFHLPAIPIQVADTVGAGDAFSAAFLCAYTRYGDARKAAMIANEVGAYVASSHGAIPDYTPRISALFA